MSTSNDNTGLTIALVGGGAFLLWLLWHGRDKGEGKGKGGDGDRSSAREPVLVWIRSGVAVAGTHDRDAELDVAGDLGPAW